MRNLSHLALPVVYLAPESPVRGLASPCTPHERKYAYMLKVSSVFYGWVIVGISTFVFAIVRGVNDSFSLKFPPQKTCIPLIFLWFFENGISVYWEQHAQELERPLLKQRRFCELRERAPLCTGRGATTVTAARPKGGQEGVEAVEGEPLQGHTA